MRNFKKWMLPLLFVAVFVGINELLNYVLYPYTYTRADVHHLAASEYEDVLVGTSHGKCGLDPQVLEEVTGHKTINVCQGGEYPLDVYYLVREAARNKKVSRVIYELDPGYWAVEPEQTADYITFYKEFPWSRVKLEYFKDKMLQVDFRTTLFPWYLYRNQIGRIPEIVKQKQSDVYKNYGVEPFASQVQEYREDGFIVRHPAPGDRSAWQTAPLWRPENLRKEAVDAFEKLWKFCREEGIELDVVMMPIPQVTYEKYQKEYDAAIRYFTEFMEERQVPAFNYLDDLRSEVPRELEMYGDYEGHMYAETAAKFSRFFAEELMGRKK